MCSTKLAEAYIDKQSELTYLPRELAIATSYGDLLGGLAKSFTDEIAAIEAAHRAPYGLAYAVDTEAGRDRSCAHFGHLICRSEAS